MKERKNGKSRSALTPTFTTLHYYLFLPPNPRI